MAKPDRGLSRVSEVLNFWLHIFILKYGGFNWWRIVMYSVFLKKMVPNEFNYNLFQNKWQSYVISYIRRQSPSVRLFLKRIWRGEELFRFVTGNTKHLRDKAFQSQPPSRAKEFKLKENMTYIQSSTLQSSRWRAVTKVFQYVLQSWVLLWLMWLVCINSCELQLG